MERGEEDGNRGGGDTAETLPPPEVGSEAFCALFAGDIRSGMLAISNRLWRTGESGVAFASPLSNCLEGLSGPLPPGLPVGVAFPDLPPDEFDARLSNGEEMTVTKFNFSKIALKRNL